MNRLQIRLLGGFEARLGDRVVRSFESRKARALLGYLAYNRQTPLSRDLLAGLLWSERSDESARRNLRQALYNVRSALSSPDDERPIFVTDQMSVQIDPELDCWVDVEEFRASVTRGLGDEGNDPGQLVAAARLYRGDLLAGFYLAGCAEFEEWLLATQEQLRDEAITVLRTLVAIYLQRGETHLGIRYAKRLLAIDPLSEESHRQLMRLYLLAGRRTRALAQYEHLRNLLTHELGVEPLAESTELYRSILLETHPDPDSEDGEEPAGPLIPMVGRKGPFRRLEKAWQAILDGSGGLTLVVGEAGVGKTRLVKSFLDTATSKRHALVLRGGCYSAAPRVPYQPFSELVAGTFTDVLPDDEGAVTRLPRQTIAELLLLAPELEPLLTDLIADTPRVDQTDEARVGDALIRLLEVLTQEDEETPLPLVLLLEDLHWADPSSLAVLQKLVAWADKRPAWILVTLTRSELETSHPVLDAAGDDAIRLERLEPRHVDTVAEALVDLGLRPKLSEFLWTRSQGLPLAVAELVNYLWDEGILVPAKPGQWELRRDPETTPPPEKLSELIHLRIQRLPTSGRRLLALAAVQGNRFEAEVLKVGGEEHLSVVEVCIELALEKWLIRQFPRSWSHSGRQRDLVLWARGARRGSFEFAHRAIRDATLEFINPLRRQVMHQLVAMALLDTHGDPESIPEHLAFHHLASGEIERALPWIAESARKAFRVGAMEVCRHYYGQASQAAKRLESGDPEDAAPWRRHWEALEELGSRLDAPVR